MRYRNPNVIQAPTAAYAAGRRGRLPRGAAQAPSDCSPKEFALRLNAWLLLFAAIPVACAGALHFSLGLILSPLLLVPMFNAAAMWPFESRAGKSIAVIWSWIWKTYLVWAVFSLFSFNLLGVLAIPSLLPAMWWRYQPFIAFMGPPFAFALIVAALLYACLRPFVTGWPRAAFGPLFFNSVLLAATLIFAEGYRRVLVRADLALHHPSCVQTDSFFSSVDAGWEDFQFHVHGTMVEDGVTYLWSYKTRRFVPQPHLQGWAC